MSSRTAPSPSSVTLALLPRKGLIRMCFSGCIHLTYDCITLDFHTREYFDRLIQALADGEPTAGAGIQLRHGPALISLNGEEYRELAGMVAHAAGELRQLDAVRRLLATSAAD